MVFSYASWINRIRKRICSFLPDRWQLVPLACIIGLIMSILSLLFYKALMVLTAFVFGLPRYALLFFPGLGALISALLICKFAPDSGGYGMDGVAKAFHCENGKITLKASLTKGLAAVFTLGFGGSGGVQAPIAQIGAGVGSTLARKLHCSVRDVRILMLAGTAAGLGAIFKSPLGGAFSSIEVMYRADTETSALVPAVFAAITSFLVYSLFIPGEAVLLLPDSMLMVIEELPAYMLLAVLCVVFGYLFVRLFHKTRAVINGLPILDQFKPLVGGILVGLIGYFYPMALGAQLKPIASIVLDDYTLRFLFTLLILKMITTCFTIGSGGSGGVFSPSLLMGGLLGALLYKVLLLLPLPIVAPPNESLVIVGMAAFFSCVAKAPIGALLMACEMTGSFELIVPLLFVNVLVVIVSRSFNIYVNQAEDRFHSPIYMKGIPAFILERTSIAEIYKPCSYFEQLRILQADEPADILPGLFQYPNMIFPVTVADKNGAVVGLLTMKRINVVRKEYDLSTCLIKDVMYPAVYCYPDDSMLVAISAFKKHYFSRLPVVDKQTHTLLGVLQYQDVFGNLDESTNG